MEKLSLNGLWQMREAGASQQYEVHIPGSVLSGLLENNAIEDPYYRENEYGARDLFWKDYEFEKVFEVSGQLMEKDCVDMVAYGLDTLAEIYVNGSLLAKTDNMHRTWRFSVKHLLQTGTNRIHIKFLSPLRYIAQYRPAENKENKSVVPCGGIKGDQYLRKAHSMFGWDWGAQLPDAGIYRDMELEAYNVTRLEDIRLTQKHENGSVKLCAAVQLKKADKKACAKDIKISAVLFGPDGSSQTVCVPVTLEEGIFPEQKLELSVENPLLWWPAGYGQQPLYRLETTLSINGQQAEVKEFTVGLRTLSVSRRKDEWGSEFAFRVNGVRIFARGANYIPEDCIYSRITPSRSENLIKACIRAHFNCIRVWGGGYYPSDAFYELCDRYGIIVWQDLMYACNVYELTEAFEENITAEAYDVVKRLRHHPSLGLWCGNNEMETGWHHWVDFNQESDYLRMDYVKIFEYILPKAVKACDAQTFYWPSSPSSGGCFDNPDDENRGDAHYWDVWHGQKPFSDYKNYFFRFCSEFGFQSFPCLKTVKTFTGEEDRNIFSKVMESHQKNVSANGKILYYISENFRYPESFDHLLYVSQILQGIAIKSGVEHWRRNRGRCMGTLYWQLNDNWPVASWSSIDYFGRFKALHYMAARFYAPCAGSLTVNAGRAEAWIQNETLSPKLVTVRLSIKDMKLQTRAEEVFTLEVPALSAQKAGELEAAGVLEKLGGENIFAEAVFSVGTPSAGETDGEYERLQTETESFVPFKHMNLEQAHIKIRVEEKEEAFAICLSTDCFAPFVELDFEELDGIFSDNYFSLSDCMGKEVLLKKQDIRNLKGEPAAVSSPEEVCRLLKIRSLRDTYAAGNTVCRQG